MNLLADLPPISACTFSDSQQFCQQIPPISAGRFGESTSRFNTPISAGRFSYSQQICWQIYLQFLLADLLTDRFGDSVGRFIPLFLLADLVTVTKLASRFMPTIFAGRFADWQIW